MPLTCGFHVGSMFQNKLGTSVFADQRVFLRAKVPGSMFYAITFYPNIKLSHFLILLPSHGKLLWENMEPGTFF